MVHLVFPSPLPNFQLAPCLPTFRISLYDSIKDRWGSNANITHDTALSALKSIKRESDIKAFFSNPLVLIAMSVASLALAALIQPISLLFAAMRSAFGIVGPLLLGYSIENWIRGVLPAMREAYLQQSEQAAPLVERLENNPQENVQLVI